MEVIFAQTAIYDLQRIGEHFLRIEPETAPQRVVAIRKACEDLADFSPKRAHIARLRAEKAGFWAVSHLLSYSEQSGWNSQDSA